MPKIQKLRGSRDELMLRGFPFLFSDVRKPPRVELFGVRVELTVQMDLPCGAYRSRSGGQGHPVGKREWFDNCAAHRS